MPALPTITVNDAQLALLMDTFAGTYGGPGQPATVAEAYKQWLIVNLKNKIYTHTTYTNRIDQIRQEHEASLQAALAALRAELDSIIG